MNRMAFILSTIALFIGIILFPKIAVQAYSSSSSNNSYISLDNYGAVGDGTTDNYLPLTNAINDAISKNLPLKIPSGTYYSSKMIGIDGKIRIYCDKTAPATIVFRDNVQYGNKPEYWQRGIMTFSGDGLLLENITLQYESNNYTQYTRNMSSKVGGEGVLLSVVDAANVTLNNVTFCISGTQNPSVTCCWFKSETADIKNIIINGCTFNHNSSSTVGGSLWLSSHDNASTHLVNIDITNCTFNEYAHDETMSFWGYNLANINVSGNTYNYLGSSTFSETFVALGAYENAKSFSNISFSRNTFNINGHVNTALQIGNLPSTSAISIYGNTFNATIPFDVDFSCIGVFDCGNAFLTNNTFNITGGKSISFILMDRYGSIAVNKAKFSASNSPRCLIVRSRYSQNYSGSLLRVNNSTFNIAASDSNRNMPTIQFPMDSTISIVNTKINTNSSAIHEIVFQTLSKPAFNTGNSSVILSSVSTDADVIFSFKGFDKRKIELTGTTLGSLYCNFDGASSAVDTFIISDCSFTSFYLNSKEDNLSSLEKYVNNLSTK